MDLNKITANWPTEKLSLNGFGEVVVRGMSAAQLDDFYAENDRRREANVPARVRARLVAVTVHGPDGERLFGDADVEKLAALPAAVLEPLADAAVRTSGIGAGAQESAEKK